MCKTFNPTIVRLYLAMAFRGLIACCAFLLSATAWEIVYQGSPNYRQASAMINPKLDYYPDEIHFCSNWKEVSAAVLKAKTTGKTVRVRSGRHSYEGFSNGDNRSLVIDVSGLGDFEFNKDKSRVQMGAGLLLGKVYSKLLQHKRLIPAGTCPTVGLGGLTLGGGIGDFSRYLGLTCDSVTELEIVDAMGNLLRVRPDNQYSDLFWACCGAGNGNFGAVVSFTFRTHIVPKRVTVFKLSWAFNAENLRSVSRRWFEMLKSAPKELMMYLVYSQRNFNVNGHFFGDSSRLRQILDPLLTETRPKLVEISQLNHSGTLNWVARSAILKQPIYPSGRPFETSSIFLSSPLTETAFLGFEKFLSPNDTDSGKYVLLDSLRGAVTKPEFERKSAFAYRDGIASVQISSSWPKNSASGLIERRKTEVNALREALLCCGDGAYVNYPNSRIKDYQEAYYGKSLARLHRIKSKYDPLNLFTYRQAVSLIQ